MPERATLRTNFLEMLSASQRAASEYKRLAADTTDPARRGQFERLARDECRHVQLAERLLEIVDA